MEDEYNKKGIIKKLITCDNMTEKEANEYFNDVMSEMKDEIKCGNITYAEEIFEEEFGLEPDYIIGCIDYL